MPDAENICRASEKILKLIASLERQGQKPLLVALDGGSGSGKSSIAKIIAEKLRATLISTDDFYSAQISDTDWISQSYIERVANVINWKSLRSLVLEPLLAGTAAQWNTFDFESGLRPDGTYATKSDPIIYEPTDIIVLEGAYSTSPELADLINVKILIHAPVEIRHERLNKREKKEFLAKWHERWDEPEQYYFQHLRPASAFDLVIDNC